MKKRGFTLIELLGVFVVLGIIFVIAVPAIMNTLTSSEEEKYDSFIKNITQASELYIENNRDYFPELNTPGGTVVITIGDLIDSGYLKENTVNPKTNENVEKSEKVVIYVNQDRTFTYEYRAEVQTLGPIVDVLLASNETYTYMNGTYLKGKISNNYVWYQGFIWRIMGKNEDGSIRMISEENITSIPWGEVSQMTNYADSYAKDWLKNYFMPRLRNGSGIVESTYCETTEYLAYNSANANCQTGVSGEIALISLDEYNLSGGRDGYLNNGQTFFTMNKGSNIGVFYIDHQGDIGNLAMSYLYGIRPVVSVSANVVVTSGDGTMNENQDTEYVLGQPLNSVSGRLSTVASIGEYVMLDNKKYRVVEKNDTSVKLALDMFYNNTAYGNNFSLGSLLTSTDLLNWLIPNKQSLVVDTTWYRGGLFGTSVFDYKQSLNSTENPYTGKVGLLQIGDVLSSQSLSILTANYKQMEGRPKDKYYWLANPYSSTESWSIHHEGGCYNVANTNTYGVRPVINVFNDAFVESGNGTLSNPYFIEKLIDRTM